MRITGVRINRYTVLGLIGSDFAISVSILGKINLCGVSDGDLFAFLHRSKRIVKAIRCTVIGIAAAVTAYNDIIVEYQGIARDDVLHINIVNVPICCNCNCIVKLTSSLIINS